jgi:hypothetical protein
MPINHNLIIIDRAFLMHFFETTFSALEYFLQFVVRNTCSVPWI